MRSLKALSGIHGGKYAVQSGMRPGETRDYWLIMESFHALFPGWICRSAQIHRSWAMRRHKEENKTRTMRVYSLVYLFEGEGTFWDERMQNEVRVGPGDLLCLFPGIAHVYAPDPGTFWNEINIEFSGQAFDAWMGAHLLDPEQPVKHLVPTGDPGQIDRWLAAFHEVVLPLAKPGVEPCLSDAGRLISLIGRICSLYREHVPDADAAWADRARSRLLQIGDAEELNLNRLASEFGLGAQAYRKKFKRLCGVTPTTFRSRYLIEKACHQLVSSNALVKTMAYELGFVSKSHFSRKFRQITGVSPAEYRRRSTE